MGFVGKLLERFRNIRTLKDLIVAVAVLVIAGIVFSAVMGLLYTVLPFLSILWRILGIVWNIICLACIVLAVLGFVQGTK